MILYNGRLDAELRGKDAAALGRADAGAAISAAQREGFAPGAILFLDQEEGGRLLPGQSNYLFSWVDTIRSSRYRPGVYCSGVLVSDASGKISTARDVLSHQEMTVIRITEENIVPAISGKKYSHLLLNRSGNS